jgi:uncharacterized membrane protein YgcG
MRMPNPPSISSSVQAEEFALKALMEASKIIQEHLSGLEESFCVSLYQESICLYIHNPLIQKKISHEILAYTKGTIEPRDVILSVCENQKADMCVVGSRGLGTLSRMLLGSVSEYVAQHCICPVVIVREQEGKLLKGKEAGKSKETSTARGSVSGGVTPRVTGSGNVVGGGNVQRVEIQDLETTPTPIVAGSKLVGEELKDSVSDSPAQNMLQGDGDLEGRRVDEAGHHARREGRARAASGGIAGGGGSFGFTGSKQRGEGLDDQMAVEE